MSLLLLHIQDAPLAGSPATSLLFGLMTGPKADENERSLHPGLDRDQMVLQVTKYLQSRLTLRYGDRELRTAAPEVPCECPFPLGFTADASVRQTGRPPIPGPLSPADLPVSAGGTGAGRRRRLRRVGGWTEP